MRERSWFGSRDVKISSIVKGNSQNNKRKRNYEERKISCENSHKFYFQGFVEQFNDIGRVFCEVAL